MSGFASGMSTVDSTVKKVVELARRFLSSLGENDLLKIKSSRMPFYDSTKGIVRRRNPVVKSLSRIESAKSYCQLFALAALVIEIISCMSEICSLSFHSLCFANNIDLKTKRKAKRTISQRDAYYTLKHLFKSQAESNAAILELGLILGLRRRKFHSNAYDWYMKSLPPLQYLTADDMGIIPASKGLRVRHNYYTIIRT